jgi:hypothetical protein
MMRERVVIESVLNWAEKGKALSLYICLCFLPHFQFRSYAPIYIRTKSNLVLRQLYPSTNLHSSLSSLDIYIYHVPSLLGTGNSEWE